MSSEFCLHRYRCLQQHPPTVHTVSNFLISRDYGFSKIRRELDMHWNCVSVSARYGLGAREGKGFPVEGSIPFSYHLIEVEK